MAFFVLSHCLAFSFHTFAYDLENTERLLLDWLVGEKISKKSISMQRYDDLWGPKVCQSGSKVTHFSFLNLQEERGHCRESMASLFVIYAWRSSASYHKGKQSLAQGRAPTFLVGLCVNVFLSLHSQLSYPSASQQWGPFVMCVQRQVELQQAVAVARPARVSEFWL